LSLHVAIFLFVAATIAGALNAVAGGGSFVAFPALLFTGVRPVPANATNTVGLWVGIVVSGGAYRARLKITRRLLIPLLTASIVGGVIGALVLIKTPTQTFLRLLPWLMLTTTLLFTFGKYLTGRIAPALSHDPTNAAVAGAVLFELLVATYGGYFGGGIGIINLAMFAMLGMTDIHSMNALKLILVTAINGVAACTFVVSGVVLWPQAGVMTIGSTLGGYVAAHYTQKLPQSWIRYFVILIGTAMTIYFFVRARH
jgi:uncharacterized membrane protein YfcA